jgi:hypothetical protein
MTDITSKNLLRAKGVLFLVVLALSLTAILLLAPDWRVAVLLALVIWSASRFYYFLFYVLEHYVDSRLKYAGILALLQAIASRRAASRTDG